MAAALTYCFQQAEKCLEEAARATDDDIRAYWKEAERCWLALAQRGEARPWPFVSKETVTSPIEGTTDACNDNRKSRGEHHGHDDHPA